jgi:hypothetical protein
MTAKFKGAVVSGIVGAASYVAAQILFRWSKLAHQSSRDLWENLGLMVFQAAVFVVTYMALARLAFRRYGYQANSSKSER